MIHSKSTNLSNKNVAIVYDRVNKWGGAERVLLALNKIIPNAPLYTSVYNPEKAHWASVFSKIHTSFLHNIPLIKTKHEILAPLMPMAFEQFNLSEYDVVISVTSESAKGVITLPKTKHICLCLTPTRYLWSGYNEYFKGQTFKGISYPIIKYLRYWDRIAAQRPDKMIAISKEVQSRIKKYYDRESEVIYPPLMLGSRYEATGNKQKRNYYLVVSRLVPYKRVDLVINTFNKLGEKLVVVGTGSEEKKLRKIANKNIEFVGFIDEKKLQNYYQGAKALVMSQHEDFGLVALEAMSFGTPVITYKAGGVLDIVQDGVNGIFFDEQTEESLSAAIKRFELLHFDRNVIHNTIEKFNFESFKNKLLNIIEE